MVPSAGPAGARARPATVRTCIGCRARADRAELLRVVAVPGPGGVAVIPDPRRRMTGRGAWVHPDPDCLDKAERRKAFGRALRVTLRLDLAPLRDVVGQGHTQSHAASAPRGDRGTTANESGTNADEHPMSTHR